MLTGDPEVVVRMLGFEVIQESNQTFSEHIVLIENCLTMGSMTKLRHQQSSLWHPGLTKDIEDLWEPWMRLVDRLLKMSNCWTRFMRRKGSDIRRAANGGVSKRRLKWCCVCCC